MQIILSEDEVKTIYDALEVAEMLMNEPTKRKATLHTTEVKVKINALLVRFRPYIK